MSARDLKTFIRRSIITDLERSQKNARTEMNKGIHVLEISPEILKKNNPGLKDTRLREVRTLTKKFIKTLLISNSRLKLYTSDVTAVDIKNTTHFILEGSDRLLLVSPSFSAIRNIVSKTSKNPDIADDPFIGSFEGKRNIYDKNDESKVVGTEDVTLSRLDIGHTANVGKEERNTVAGKRIRDAFGIIGGINKHPLKAKYLNQLEKIHSPYQVSFEKDSLSTRLIGKLEFIYTVPQSRELNRSLGTLEKRVLNDLRKFILDVRGSKSLRELTHDRMIDLFLEKKKRVSKNVTRTHGNLDINIGKASTVSKSLEFRLRKKTGTFTNLISLQSLFNLRLHDQIQRNMGKGSATEKLNYRTGRFARSANIVSMHQSQDRVVANYTFMRHPYDVFMPGGRLHKTGRDPEKLINRSIRQLATELVYNKFKVYPKLAEGV